METPLPWSVDAFPGHVRFGCSDKANGVELGLKDRLSAPIPGPAKLENGVGWDFIVAGSQRIVWSPSVRSQARGWRRPPEAEHELRLWERSSCSRRAPACRGGEGVLGSRRAGPRLGGRARPVGGGLRSRGSQFWAPGGPRRAGGQAGRGAGLACCVRGEVGARGGRLGACRGGGEGAQLQRAPPTESTAEHGGGGPAAPAQS